MNERYKYILSNTKALTPPENLRGDILAKINSINQKRAREKYLLTSSLSVMSFVGLVFGVLKLISDFSETGFYQYSSLIFSEGINIVGFWKELALSLTETFPVMSLSIVLSALVVFLWSIVQSLGNRVLVMGAKTV